MRAWMVALSLWFASPAVLAGCGEPAEQIRSKTASVACGTCIFKLKHGRGCYWAAEIDGKPYTVMGTLPTDHGMHSPTGMCNMTRTATLDGTISGNTFIATRFDLHPAESAPEAPRFTEDDVHDASWDASKDQGKAP